MEGLDLAVFGAHTHDRVFGRWHGPADEFVVAIGVVEVFEEVDGRQPCRCRLKLNKCPAPESIAASEPYMPR